MPDTTDRELDWQAFLYVTDAMPAEAAEAFEVCLADGQEAREAVARAVELLTKLTVIPSFSTNVMPVVASSRQRSIRFAGAATVAALLLVCWLLSRTSNNPDGATGDAARQLVSLWTESDSSAENGALSDREVTAGDDESDLAVPSWVLAAVESASKKTSEEN